MLRFPWVAVALLALFAVAVHAKKKRVAEEEAAEPRFEAPEDKDKAIEELLAGLKGQPGMENLHMMRGDEMEKMAAASEEEEEARKRREEAEAERKNRPKKKRRPKNARELYRRRLVDFYHTYGLHKVASVDDTLVKWYGREDQMFAELESKYADLIKKKNDAAWEFEEKSKQEL